MLTASSPPTARASGEMVASGAPRDALRRPRQRHVGGEPQAGAPDRRACSVVGAERRRDRRERRHRRALHHFGDADGAAASAALATLANLTVVGAIFSPSMPTRRARRALSTAGGRGSCRRLAHADATRRRPLDPLRRRPRPRRGRQLLASLGVARGPLRRRPHAMAAIEPLPEAKRQATQALAHFAADEATSPQLGDGARRRCSPRSSRRRGPARLDVRACALSAANFRSSTRRRSSAPAC